MATARRRSTRGVSLVEALVALAVMAIGMLGLVGMQSTLRANSDAAKQRSEAVRLAQEAIEEWRAFAVLTPTAGVTDYADLVPGTTTDPAIVGSNATYTRTRTVTAMPAPRAGKSLLVDVSWQDRAGETQSVQLSTVVAGIAPELSAMLSIPTRGDATGGSPQGRHRAIPPGAIQLGGTLAGRSGLIPPGASGVAWVFDNVSALMTICTTTASSTALLLDTNISCGTDNAVLLAGFLRYALGNTPPTTADALNPPSPPSAMPAPLQLWVQRTAPSALDVACYTEDVVAPSFYTAYLCAIPVTVTNNIVQGWSGRLDFRPASLMAATLAETSATRVKSCRYFANGSYADVTGPRANQNYLVIRAGDGLATAFACPAPTLAHQPTS